MARPAVYEGTLDEINARYGKELSGRHLKIIVDEGKEPENRVVRPFHESATPEEWIEALQAWATEHVADRPFLSDKSIDRDSIYEGRGE